jgi:hypothetical protein
MRFLWLGCVAVGSIGLAGAAAALAGCEVDVVCVKNCGTGGATSSTTASTDSVATSTSESSSTGEPAKWALPACTSVAGMVPLTFSADRGATLAPFEAKPAGIAYFNGLVASDAPNVLYADYAGGFFESKDAGCSFELVHPTEIGPAALVPAPGGGAYGFVPNDFSLYRYEPIQGFRHLPDQAETIMGVAADEKDSLHVRMMTVRGALLDSHDAGETFAPISGPLYVDAGSVYTAVFDPHDLDHVFMGVITDGGYITFDGGATWKLVTGLGKPEGNDKANGFAGVVSPLDSNVVWVEGISLGLPAAMPPVSDDRHVFLSVDGGASFAAVVDDMPTIVTLTNGVPMLPDPADAGSLYFEFGTYFDAYGTDIYRYDGASKKVTKTHNPYDDMLAFVASPADPTFLYFGVTTSKIQ